MIPTQLPAILLDFISRIANIFEILSNLRLIMMPTVIMTNITPVILIMSLVVTVPLAVMTLLAVMIVFPEMIMVLFILGVGSRRCSRNNQNPGNHRAQN